MPEPGVLPRLGGRAVRRRRWRRIGLPVLSTIVALAPVVWLWSDSLMPASYSVLQMGVVDYGGGPAGADHDHHGSNAIVGQSVSRLIEDPDLPADVTVDLVAREQSITVGDQQVPGFTLNGQTPGPLITATAGELIEVHLRNASVADGITLHWHGIDVPNAEDGVAGVTQDAVAVGNEFTYRFVADHAGTFWYHSHQTSNAQVTGGLFGPMVIKQAGPVDHAEVVATAHTYGGVRTLNGVPADLRVDAEPGRPVRVRVINTDNGPLTVWSVRPFKLLAIDGRDLHRPSMINKEAVRLAAGGRVDLLITPTAGVPARVSIGASTSVIIGAGTAAAIAQPHAELDLLKYGTPATLPFDATRPDRRFEYVIGRRPGFYKGKPGLYWSVNGRLYPDVPMYMVTEGDVVVMRLENHSGEVHPMHLHGHHAVVLSRNDVPSTGSPWWIDSLNVEDGESYEIAFLADNPGIWMDHCHNLKHAANGMIAHLMYEGVTTPFTIGGAAGNEPE